METSLIPQSNHGIMVDGEELGSMSSSSDFSRNSIDSSSSDLMEDATSSILSSSPPSLDDQLEEGPLHDMSSLMAQLPFKRGLSKHFQGKSQSFTSLSSVRCLEDLAKPERPSKKMKPSKSYGGGLDTQKSLSPKGCSRTITKKTSRGSFSSLIAKRSSFMGNKPPIPPQRSNYLSTQTLLFA